VVMGVLSVWLLSLDGAGGLKGWQWLFVVEGLPAVVVGVVVLWLLPDGPRDVRWLSDAEKSWLARTLAAEAPRAGAHRSVLSALRLPAVLLLGVVGFLTTMAYFTFTLSEPQILGQATGWSVRSVGYLVSLGGLAGAGGMLFTGWLSDRVGTRAPFMLGGTAMVLLGYALFALGGGRDAGLIGYACYVACWGSVTLSVWMLCTDLVAPADMAVATALVNTMSQAGAFVGPILWGMARDATGGFALGFRGLVMTQALALVFAGLVVRQARAGRRVALPIP
jgi:MFS transporter, ACS family, tartrate transporter